MKNWYLAFLNVGLVLSISLQANANLPSVANDDNVIPVMIPNAKGAPFNRPFVTVTVCKPNTSTCQEIDNIQLDSGSVGLRLFPGALNFDLPLTKDASQRSLVECYAFLDGHNLWGAVRSADLRVGKENARAVQVQIAEAKSMDPSCQTDANLFVSTAHGILGVAPSHEDCKDRVCDSYSKYSYCSGSTCSGVEADKTLHVQNPIFKFSQDNNGFVLRFPDIQNGQQSDAEGALIFGIDTRANNKRPANLIQIPVASPAWFWLNIAGQDYWTGIDTGSETYVLPPSIGVAECGEGELSGYLCPNQPLQLTGNLKNGQGLSFILSNPTHLDWSNRAFSELAFENGPADSKILLLGMPFFFGRSIFYWSDQPIGAGENSYIGIAQ